MSSDFASDYRETPYWWDASPPTQPSGNTPPAQADVVIIGSGYTGLHAAIATARAGFSAVVLERDALGAGCSTRNGGQISTSIKPSFNALSRRYSEATARALLTHGGESLKHIAQFVRNESVDCSHAVVGRYHSAHTASAYRRLAASHEAKNPVFDDEATLVPRDRQREELGSDCYYGGIIYPQHASLDPGRYHAGCVTVARRAGVDLVDHCAATRITPSSDAFSVHTERGAIKSRRVIVATNGYTTGLTPWLQQRVIPIGSYIIATEELLPDLMQRLLPTKRILSDTRRLVYYYRPSPDGKRILFGGRVSLAETDSRVSGRRLLKELRRLFPELSTTRITHSWSGTVAYTFDSLAHVGKLEGVYHALGYCGSGVGMAGYSGQRIGQRVVEDLTGGASGATADGAICSSSDAPDIAFPTRPLYNGKPWFLAPSVMAYRVLDRLGV